MASRLIACVVIPHLLMRIARQQESIAATHPLAVVSTTIERAIIIDSCPRAAALGVQVGMSAFGCSTSSRWDVSFAILRRGTADPAGYAGGDWLVLCGRAWGAAHCVTRIAVRVASERDSHRPIIILPGTETTFLAPLPVQLLPGLGEQTAVMLARLGITTIGQLAALPERVLLQLAGPRGGVLRLHARGLDADHPHIARQILTSRWHFQRTPCADEQQLCSCVYRLIERVGRRLRAKALAPGEIIVRLRWLDGLQWQARTRFAARCDLDHQLAHGSHAALHQLLQARWLAVTLRWRDDRHERRMAHQFSYQVSHISLCSSPQAIEPPASAAVRVIHTAPCGRIKQ